MRGSMAGEKVKINLWLFMMVILTFAIAGPRSAVAAEVIPDEIAQYFSQNAADDVRAFEENADAEKGVAVIDITAVQKTYVIDVDGTSKVTFIPSDLWTAVAVRNGKPVGTSTVWRDGNGELQPGWSDGVQYGEILLQAHETGAKYAEAQWANCRFLWKDGILTPLDDFTKETISHEMTESEALTILQAKWDDEKVVNDDLAEQGIIPVGGGTSTDAAMPVTVATAGVIAMLATGVVIFIAHFVRTRVVNHRYENPSR